MPKGVTWRELQLRTKEEGESAKETETTPAGGPRRCTKIPKSTKPLEKLSLGKKVYVTSYVL